MRIVREKTACRGVDTLPGMPLPMLYARDELIRFIRAKTGCELPSGSIEGKAIFLRLVNDGDKFRRMFSSHPVPESYVVDSDKENIYLTGADSSGVVYAVFDFLRREAGIGFGGLGESGVRLNCHPNLDIRIRKRTCQPEFTYRGFQGTIPEDEKEINRQHISPLHTQRLD